MDESGAEAAARPDRRPAPRPRPAPVGTRRRPAGDDAPDASDTADTADTATAADAEGPEGSGSAASVTSTASGTSGSSAGAAGADREGSARRRAGYPLVAGLLVLALVLSGAAVFFKIRHSEAAAATSNTALVDVATTAEVKEAMSNAAERLFSVDYNNLDKTQQAADELLVGEDVKKTYDALMRQVRENAPKQKLVVTVTATRSAVVLLDDNRARVMVYVDQTATRTESNQTSTGGSAMWFETERRDGEWKILDMDTYAAAGTVPQPTPSSQVEEPTTKPTEGN